jgi:hypothetical protein
MSVELLIGWTIGLVAAMAGAYFQALWGFRWARKDQRERARIFFGHVINNICTIVAEMEGTREKAQAIHSDYLYLIKEEIDVYTRNREHLIFLDVEGRESVRKFMIDVMSKRATIAIELENFYKARHDESILPEGGDRDRKLAEASAALGRAQSAADKLFAATSGAKQTVLNLTANGKLTAV